MGTHILHLPSVSCLHLDRCNVDWIVSDRNLEQCHLCEGPLDIQRMNRGDTKKTSVVPK